MAMGKKGSMRSGEKKKAEHYEKMVAKVENLRQTKDKINTELAHAKEHRLALKENLDKAQDELFVKILENTQAPTTLMKEELLALEKEKVLLTKEVGETLDELDKLGKQKNVLEKNVETVFEAGLKLGGEVLDLHSSIGELKRQRGSLLADKEAVELESEFYKMKNEDSMEKVEQLLTNAQDLQSKIIDLDSIIKGLQVVLHSKKNELCISNERAEEMRTLAAVNAADLLNEKQQKKQLEEQIVMLDFDLDNALKESLGALNEVDLLQKQNARLIKSNLASECGLQTVIREQIVELEKARMEIINKRTPISNFVFAAVVGGLVGALATLLSVNMGVW